MAMLSTVKELHEYAIHATDGDLGRVVDVFFDDETWTVRYFVVETGHWLSSRRVLISPIAVRSTDSNARTLAVDLTREQLARSPDVDTEKPLSRQKELEYREYFAWPWYWFLGFGEPYTALLYPRSLAAETAVQKGDIARREPLMSKEPGDDPHLRSTEKVIGYQVVARDGEAGHVEDFIVDLEGWRLRHLVVKTGSWLGGRRVLVSLYWVKDVSWEMSAVHVRLPRSRVSHAKEFHTLDG
jgi:uncharacterized protein YrrD